MPTIIKATGTALLLLLACLLASGATAADALKPFAIEFRTGPAWDASRAPHEQQHFREHGAKLQALRATGRLAMGARYGDVGLIVLRAADVDAVRELLDRDPAVQAGVFVYTVQPMNIFYPWKDSPRQP